MKISIFVSGVSALLAAWLGVTFVRDVPNESYPELGRSPGATVEVVDEADLSAALAPEEPAMVMD